MISRFNTFFFIFQIIYCENNMAGFVANGVVPDVVDVEPQQVLSVHYNSGVDVNAGNVLTPRQVKDQPELNWNADSNSYYTVIMTDPDAPSRAEPTYREWHHWVVVNVPGNRVSEGEVKSAYVGSGPPPGTGLHRYVFLVYRQNDKQDFSAVPTNGFNGNNRAKFSARNFAKEQNLGELVAGNFYQAEYDDWVPELYKLLG